MARVDAHVTFHHPPNSITVQPSVVRSANFGSPTLGLGHHHCRRRCRQSHDRRRRRRRLLRDRRLLRRDLGRRLGGPGGSCRAAAPPRSPTLSQRSPNRPRAPRICKRNGGDEVVGRGSDCDGDSGGVKPREDGLGTGVKSRAERGQIQMRSRVEKRRGKEGSAEQRETDRVRRGPRPPFASQEMLSKNDDFGLYPSSLSSNAAWIRKHSGQRSNQT